METDGPLRCASLPLPHGAARTPRTCTLPRAPIRGGGRRWRYGTPMGRPPVSSEERVATAVRFPKSLHQRLHGAATDRDVSVNLLVTKAVALYLDRLPGLETVLEPQHGDTPADATT